MARSEPGLKSGRLQRGFTLLELLIALTLVSLIVSLLYGGLRLGSRTWEAVDQRVTRTEEQRLVRGFLRRALLQARQVEWKVGNGHHALFYGNSDQLEFVSPLSGYVGLGGLYLMRLSLVPHGEGKSLVLQRWLLHPDVLDGQGVVPQWRPLQAPAGLQVPFDEPNGVYGVSLLMQSVDELAFRYFGKNMRSVDETWQTEWKDRPGMPSSVGLRIGPEDDWPEIIVPLASG